MKQKEISRGRVNAYTSPLCAVYAADMEGTLCASGKGESFSSNELWSESETWE